MSWDTYWEPPRSRDRLAPIAGAGVGLVVFILQLLVLRFALGVGPLGSSQGVNDVLASSRLPLIFAQAVFAGLAGGAAAGAIRVRRREGQKAGLPLALAAGILAGAGAAVLLAAVVLRGPLSLTVPGVLIVVTVLVMVGAVLGIRLRARSELAVAISAAAAIWLGEATRKIVALLLMPTVALDEQGDITPNAARSLALLRTWSPIAYAIGVALAIALSVLVVTAGRPRPATALAGAAAPLIVQAAAVLLAVPFVGVSITVVGSVPNWIGLLAGCLVGAAIGIVPALSRRPADQPGQAR